MTSALAAQLDDLDRRVAVVEQVASGAQVAGDPIPAGTEVVDTTTGDIVTLTLAPPDTPTDVAATPGTFFEDIFVDVTWTAPLGAPPDVADPSSYQVELAERTAGPTYDLVDLVVTLAPNARFNSLKPNKDYSVRVTAVSVVGKMSDPTDWVDFTTGADATLPATPTGLNVFRGADAIIASWNENAEPDVAHGHGLYQVELSADDFATILQSYRTASTVIAFEGLFTEATYKVRVAAIDSSNNQSAAWAVSANTTGGAIITTMIKDDAITTPKLVAGAVITDRLAAGAVTAAKIQAGTITANEIAGNTITADKMTTSSLTAATITLSGSGSLKAGTPPTTGVIFNSQGIRLYSGGVVQVALDVSGTATFSGSVTASSISGSTITGSTITGNTITGGTITGVTVTGGTIQTATTAPRIRMLNHPTAGAPLPAQAGASAGEYLEFHTGYLGSTSDDYNPGIMFARSWNNAASLEFVAPRPTNAWPSSPAIQMITLNGGISFGQINISVGNFSIGGAIGGGGGALFVQGSITANTVNGTNTFNGATTFYGTVTLSGSSITLPSTVNGNLTFSGTITFNGTVGFGAAATYFNAIVSTQVDVGSGALIGQQGGGGRAANIRARNGSDHFTFDMSGTSFVVYKNGSPGWGFAPSLSKTFVIDHPLNPDKYLIHACIEGPENGVYQRGKGSLVHGEATVELPVYFEALTQEEDRTVQVTPITNGRPVPRLAASYPKDGRFEVRGLGDCEFFWHVYAVRKDVPELLIEPNRSEILVGGDGPYRYYQTKEHTDAV